MLKPGIFNDDGYLKLSAMARLVVLTVENMMNSDGILYARLDTVARACGISEKRVKPYVRELAPRWLSYTPGDGRGHVSMFERGDDFASKGGRFVRCIYKDSYR